MASVSQGNAAAFISRGLWSTWILLVAAIVLVSLFYFPTRTVRYSQRSDDLSRAIAVLKSEWSDLMDSHPNLERQPASLQGVEQALRELHEATKQGASDTGGVVSGSLNSVDQSAMAARLRGELGNALLSKLFGPEQFVIYCLTVWSGAMLLGKKIWLRVESEALQSDPLRLDPGTLITPSRALELLDPARQREQNGRLVFQSVERMLQRFVTTADIAAVETALRADADRMREDFQSETGMVRFAIWAIPSVGFIGTVRGIGSALASADSPESLPAVVGWLGVAFDTTLIALLLSIPMMFLLHEVQQQADRFVLRFLSLCEDKVVLKLQPLVIERES